MSDETLHLAETPYDSGELRYRYECIPSDDGSRWIRHGLFQAYHKNGNLASEGRYEQGAEEGLWRDYHENGLLAAEGHYHLGKEQGLWRTWNDDGTPGNACSYIHGVEQECDG